MALFSFLIILLVTHISLAVSSARTRQAMCALKIAFLFVLVSTGKALERIE